MDCEIRTNPSLHAKATVTSRGVLSGSFNLTMSGRGMNIEAGFYFPNTIETEKEEYDQKLNWVKERDIRTSYPVPETNDSGLRRVITSVHERC
jgi:hypothetical protein